VLLKCGDQKIIVGTSSHIAFQDFRWNVNNCYMDNFEMQFVIRASTMSSFFKVFKENLQSLHLFICQILITITCINGGGVVT